MDGAAARPPSVYRPFLAVFGRFSRATAIKRPETARNGQKRLLRTLPRAHRRFLRAYHPADYPWWPYGVATRPIGGDLLLARAVPVIDLVPHDAKLRQVEASKICMANLCLQNFLKWSDQIS